MILYYLCDFILIWQIVFKPSHIRQHSTIDNVYKWRLNTFFLLIMGVTPLTPIVVDHSNPCFFISKATYTPLSLSSEVNNDSSL